MLRFIFVCMGVVALSTLSIVLQVMTDGISDTHTQIAERNAADNTVVAVAPPEPEFSEDQLNSIETAAGADDTDTGFGAAFTNEAPKALVDSTPTAAIEPSAE